MLLKAKSLGHIYIITNAEEGRVQKTASLYLPKVEEFLTKYNVKVVSAKARYEQVCPNKKEMWKILAFSETRVDMVDNIVKNLILVGDDVTEL